MKRDELLLYLNNLLKPELFDDYCPNGLQIEGKENIEKILFSVSATKESVEYAAQNSFDALIVHHGLFWKFHGTRSITGSFYKRISPLIKSDINLFGYHLPLDGHIEIGNAASIAKLLKLKNIKPFGLYKNSATGVSGDFESEINPTDLKNEIQKITNHSVISSSPISKKTIKNIGIITGGANSEWKEAFKSGLDAYLTGEMSEHDYHESSEDNIYMFAAGHHATEKIGIQSLMAKIQQFNPSLKCEFLDSDNPA